MQVKAGRSDADTYDVATGGPYLAGKPGNLDPLGLVGGIDRVSASGSSTDLDRHPIPAIPDQ